MVKALRLGWVLVSTVMSVVVLAAGCASTQDGASGERRPIPSSPAATIASTLATVIPLSPRHPYRDYFLEDVDEAVAAVIGRHLVYDAGSSPAIYREVMVRVFRDAPPAEVIIEAAAPAIAEIDDRWEPGPPGSVTVDVVHCPFTATQWETVDVYLRSLDWRDPDKERRWDAGLGNIARGPELWDIPGSLHEFVHCKVWFPVRDITVSEIERIRDVALANDVLWVEFTWTTQPIGEPAFDDPPRDPPPGFLPHFELPWYCTPPACTGHEEELQDG